jgi:signal transduction histidine kinase
MPRRLLSKLLVINSFSLMIVLLAIGLAVHLLAADYFSTLMHDFNIAPEDAHSMFLRAVDRYLLLASVVGFAIATLLSVWLNYRLTSPVAEIIRSAQMISAGDYGRKVQTQGCGEIDQLSAVFNEMAGSLQRAERLRKDFIVDVAHELRTPLTNILGYTEGLRDAVIAPDTAVFSLIHEESQRLVNLVEDLMQLARADVAGASLKRERVNINDLIQQTVQQFRRRLDEKSIEVRVQASASVEVDADMARIIQVLTNLMENAWRYSPVGGTVDLHVTEGNSSIKVLLVNQAEEEAVDPASLFERFRRGDSSRSRQSGGAGLGLAIVKELIHAHGGQVGSQFRNGTAEFWFELPNLC